MSLPIPYNPLDPRVFQDRDACVYDVQQAVMRLLNERGVPMDGFGPCSRMVLECSLQALYESNGYPDTMADGMLGVMDVASLLDDHALWDSWRGAGRDGEAFRDWVLSRALEPSLLAWFSAFEDWPSEIRAEVVAPLRSRLVSVSTLDLGELRAGGSALAVDA